MIHDADDVEQRYSSVYFKSKDWLLEFYFIETSSSKFRSGFCLHEIRLRFDYERRLEQLGRDQVDNELAEDRIVIRRVSSYRNTFGTFLISHLLSEYSIFLDLDCIQLSLQHFFVVSVQMI